MKAKILDQLKTKFVGVSEDVLNRIADKISKTVKEESEVDNAVSGVKLMDLLQSYGDSRADEAQKSAVANYEKKYGLREGKPDQKPAVQPGSDEPDWFKAYREANDKKIADLTQANESLKAEKSKNERKAAISSKAKELGIPDVFVKRIHIADDEDIEKTLTDIKQDLVNSRLLPKGSTREAVIAQEETMKKDAQSWAKSLPDK